MRKKLGLCRGLLKTCAGAAVAMGLCSEAFAVEGGIGSYFMGTRDTLAGIVPPPGTYLSFTYDHLEGDVTGITLGGLPVRAKAEVELNLIRLGFTTSFENEVLGGTPAFNLTIPVPDISLEYTAITPPLVGRGVRDTQSGIGDLSVTGILGWRRGNFHYNTAFTLYMPTGDYDIASIDLSNRSVDLLSSGKNVWSFQPAIAATWLNPETGFELSGAASLLWSTENDETNYQTGVALQLEGAVVQRIRSGWGFGLTGYHYQQLEDDSGRGADLSRRLFGADSLKARVSGIGPIVTYSGGQLFGGDVSVKFKYVNEFDAKRRLESDVFTANISLAF